LLLPTLTTKRIEKMAKIMVYPTKASALNVPHPIDHKVKVGGSLWEYDGETCRGLVDGWITDDPAKQWTPDKENAEETTK
jgi:hypothetical protein